MTGRVTCFHLLFLVLVLALILVLPAPTPAPAAIVIAVILGVIPLAEVGSIITAVSRHVLAFA